MADSAHARNLVLSARRNLKMARSAHAYVRGSTVKFYEWLLTAAGRSVPEGPAIWICGDCHVGNLGPIADAKDRVRIQIRDLDQTVIGNPAHDLIRLGLSLATAARGADLPGVITARMLEELSAGYQNALNHPNLDLKPLQDQARPVKIVLRQAVKRTWKMLAHERIEDTTPTIPLGKRFWPLNKQEFAAVRDLFNDEQVRQLVTCLRSRHDKAEIELKDAAYWVKGCSSLGRLRIAALVEVQDRKRSMLCLIDIKEALKAAAPSNPEREMPADHAERVVTGARQLSPALGERMLAAHLLSKPVFVRELLPQDMKLDIAELTISDAIATARFLATVLGVAHARQMTPAERQAWRRTLRNHHRKTLETPSWLWRSVVELIGIHEHAYLEHCRVHALSTAPTRRRLASKGVRQLDGI